MLSTSTIQHSMLATRVSFYQKETNQAMDRISSGSKLNQSWEAPAAFAVAETYRTQVTAATSVSSSLQDALNIVRIGEDGVRSIVEVLQNMRDMALQAANGTNNQDNLDFYQTSLDTMRPIILQSYRTAQQFRVSFEGDEQFDRKLRFMVGTDPNDTLEVDYNPLRDTMKNLVLGLYGYEELYNDPTTRPFLNSLGIYPTPAPNDPIPDANAPVPPFLLRPGIDPPGTTWGQRFPNLPSGLPTGSTWKDAFPKTAVVNDVSDPTKLQKTFQLLDTAKAGMLKQETYLGTISQRLEIHLTVVQKFATSMASAESSLRDADLAVESTRLTKSQVLQQASQAMLVQANNRLAQVLELIRQQ